MSYGFVLTDLAGTELSELAGAKSKSTAIPVVGMGTSSVQVRSDSDEADMLLEGDKLLRVYDVDDETHDKVLISHNRLVTAEEAASADQPPTVAATFADPFWVLVRRLCGKSTTGYTRGTALAPVDRGTIITELVDGTNAEGVSGVRMGVVTPSSSTYVGPWYYKPIGETVAELGATLDGPDWRIRPIEYDGGYIGELDVAASMGQLQQEAIFEYGDGALNVKSFKRSVSFEGCATSVFNLPPGFPDSATAQPLNRINNVAVGQRGLLEAVVTADLPSDDLRAKLLEYHLAARYAGRQTITWEPVRDVTGKRVPRFGRDFTVGDILPFRASIMRRGILAKRINVLQRVYQFGVTVDEAGAGTATLTTTAT